MDQIWWNHIIKARSFFEEIVSETVEGGSILLSLPDTIPWRNTLIDIVSERLRVENSKNNLDVIECPDMDPGEYLLEQYCKKEIRATYRYGVSYAKFLGLCQETVLNDRYLWISNISSKKIDEWINFVSEYQKNVKDKTPGIFILEVHDDILVKKNKKGIKGLAFNQSIGAYDKYAFCALAASQTTCKEYLRPFLAEIVSSVCGDDVELCAACVSYGKEFLESPIAVINKIVQNNYRSDGKKYIFNKNSDDIEEAVWESQLKYIFPLIEDYRKYFIRKYSNIIKNVLPLTTSYGEKVTCPEDVELGTLIYMVGKGDLNVSSREYTELERYRNARNKLAHMNLLDIDELNIILKIGKHTLKELNI